MNRAALPSKLCTTCGARYAADALFCPSDGTPLSSNAAAEKAHASGPDAPDAYLGREISGHIEIRQLAGVGAMGRVYRAFQKGIDRDVAVKILHRELSANQQLVARFHREAKVASRLQHPNVVQVHLAGQLPDGAMYIVMEYLDGLSLQSALAAAGGSMPLPRAMHVALQLCDAAGEAHAQGVVHRDLKPENVMLVRRADDADYVKVLDFGIARLNWGEQSMATAAGLIFGTARYISPEGAQGEQVGPAGDVYSIATLLYQILSGRTPFEGDQAVALLVAQIHDPPPHLTTIPRAAYVPEAIANAIMRNLAKDASARDPDARTFGRALLEAAKASGMSPDELIVRSGLLGARQSGAMQLPPMQRTKQLDLTPDVVERMRGASPASDPARDSRPSPPDDARFPPPHAAPGNATTKWTPPPGFAALLTPAPHAAPPTPTPAPSAPRSEPRATDRSAARTVDETLDDESAPIVPAPAPSAPFGIHAASVAPLPAAAARAPSPSEPRVASTAPGTVPPRAYAGPATPPPAHVRAPRAVVDTLDGDEPVASRRRGPRAFALVALVLLLGATLGGVVAYRRGLIGARPAETTATATLDEQVARARDALKQKRWDAPPGDNVRDLTNDALARWPGDARLLDLRARATDELVKEALGAKFAGDAAGALHLARLARELDPSDTTAQKLADELERAEQPATVPTASASRPNAPLAQAARPAGQAPPPPGATKEPRALLDASSARPRVGQQVDLVAKIIAPTGGAPKSAAEDPHFQIVGPGGAATRLPAAPDTSGTYKASFSFLEAGRYEVTFNAKSDGATVHATRTIVAGTSASGAPNTPAGEPTAPPPAPSGKWL